MLNIVPDRLVAPGLLNRPSADVRFETAPHPSAKRSENTTRVEAAFEEHPTRHRHRPIPGRIGRIGSLQSPSNPHTSTALAA